LGQWIVTRGIRPSTDTEIHARRLANTTTTQLARSFDVFSFLPLFTGLPQVIVVIAVIDPQILLQFVAIRGGKDMESLDRFKFERELS
jgi:hypothetical protein